MRSVKWPSHGITGPGAWGSRDGVRWEKVEGPLVCAPGGFTTAVLIQTPQEARRWMRFAFGRSL